MTNVLAPQKEPFIIKASPKVREKGSPPEQKDSCREWRRETSNGFFTVFSFKPRRCSVCHGPVTPRHRTHLHNRILRVCRRCVCRENATIKNSIGASRNPVHYDCDGGFHSEKWYSYCLFAGATVNLE